MDRDDRHHEESLDLLQMGGILPVIPTMVIAEATYIVGTRLGPEVEARFLEGLAGLDIRPPSPDDWARIGELVRRYHDLPLGGTDASVVALAERLDAELVITLDRRHFSVVRPRHRDSLTIVP